MRQLAFKLLFLILFLMMCGFNLVNAQSFEGVWSPSNEKMMWGKMKINKVDEKHYKVQMKTTEKMLSCIADFIDGELHCTFMDEVNYGKWWLGTYDGETGNILQGGEGNSFGSIGQVTKIYDASYNRRYHCATKEIGYIKFILKQNDDNIELHTCFSSDYLANDRVVFSQSSYYVKVDTYTNW